MHGEAAADLAERARRVPDGLAVDLMVALVTATPMNANRVIVVGRPMAWPRTWSRWDFA
jgi:hypothetical protein